MYAYALLLFVFFIDKNVRKFEFIHNRHLDHNLFNFNLYLIITFYLTTIYIRFIKILILLICVFQKNYINNIIIKISYIIIFQTIHIL